MPEERKVSLLPANIMIGMLVAAEGLATKFGNIREGDNGLVISSL
jgi:hypothetical protein